VYLLGEEEVNFQSTKIVLEPDGSLYISREIKKEFWYFIL
jgi:hypothetical protein